jgi:hypothetical protein
MNRFTDIDAGWWPFLHLRPARSERMDNRCLARMALHYGIPVGLLVYGWYVHVGFVPLSVLWAAMCVVAAVAFLFVGYKYTFAVAWNRRADQLRRQARGDG